MAHAVSGERRLKHVSTWASLSTRERDILLFMALGLTNVEIGELLNVSEETVKSHIKNILFKMNARNRTYAVSLGWETDFIDKTNLQRARKLFLLYHEMRGRGLRPSLEELWRKVLRDS